MSTPSSLSSKSVDFLIISCAGTHVKCSAPTPADRDEWLAALHVGLEGGFPESRVETLVVLSKRHTSKTGANKFDSAVIKRTRSKTDMMVQSAIDNAKAAFFSENTFRTLVPPPPQVDAKNARLARRTLVKMSSNLELDGSSSYHYGGHGSSECAQKTGYHSPCDDWTFPPSETHCIACGRYPPEHAMRIDAAPLPEYGMEVRVDLCHDCWIAQGVLRHVRYLGWLYEVDARERSAIRLAWEEVKNAIDRFEAENASDDLRDEFEDERKSSGHPEVHVQEYGSTSLTFGAEKRSSLSNMDDVSLDDLDINDPKQKRMSNLKKDRKDKLISQSTPPPPTFSMASNADVAYSNVLLKLVNSTIFSEYRRRSNRLDFMCKILEKGGRGCASVFLENIEECAQASVSSCLYGDEDEWEEETDDDVILAKEKIGLKKEAFKVAGDMSAALKLLYDYALPPDRGNLPPTSNAPSSQFRDNADMLAAILEFFLDLCDEGQLEAVAFFWPQLCHIHMQMLPPMDTEELTRVELMEDFLLTVATRYSVHLALDLVWGLIADLEESLGSSNCHAASRRRRFAVLRFVSELESLLFGFEGGWGGGGVSLHGMLSPSQHQSVLIRDAMSLLQLQRRFGSHFLTRSVRLEMLRAEALESLGEYPSSIDGGAKVRAQIAKNAAYFSSHVAFARKLGDIAEKLRFTEVEQRSETLRLELKELNGSGRVLGGDPLNRLCGGGSLYKAVRIPINEGHVFRSKERTPVLLLTELVRDVPLETTNEKSGGILQTLASTAKTVAVEVITTQCPPLENDNSELNTDDDSSQASATSAEGNQTTHKTSSCPHTPTTPNRNDLDDSDESPGKSKFCMFLLPFLFQPMH